MFDDNLKKIFGKKFLKIFDQSGSWKSRDVNKSYFIEKNLCH